MLRLIDLPPSRSQARAGIAPAELHGWLLRHARLCVSPGDEFAPETGHCVRINVACPRRMLHAALEQLRRAVATAATGDPALDAGTQGAEQRWVSER